MSRSPIEHLIVLMMENRSFDHLLGYLKYPPEKEFEGLAGREERWACRLPDGRTLKPGSNAAFEMEHDPDHSHPGVMRQLIGDRPYALPYRPDNLGFARDYDAHHPGQGQAALECFPPERLPVLSTLAQEFAVCDHWFSSLPGATWPNRTFAHAATSDGEVDNDTPHAYSNPTIFDRLTASGQDWAIYYGGFPPQSLVFSNLWARPLLSREPNWLQRYKPIENFYRAVQHDRLPRYAFIEPDMFGLVSNSQHPGMGGERDFLAGELLMWEIYECLRSHPAVFAKTLLLITYDEHGGFFDHMPPPQSNRFRVSPLEPGAQPVVYIQGDYRFEFDFLGPRVPAVLVSPWIEKGTVDHTQYDHSSIPATVRALFHTGDALTTRDRDANTFDRNLSLSQPRTDLPAIARPTGFPERREAARQIELGDQLMDVLTSLVWDALRERPGALTRRLLPGAGQAGSRAVTDVELQVHARVLAEIAPELSPEGQQALVDAPPATPRDLGEARSTAGGLVSRAVRVLQDLAKELENLGQIDDLQRFVESALRRYYQDRNLILHRADGSVVLEPGPQDLRQAVDILFDQGGPGQVWLADHLDRWLVVDASGRTALYDRSPGEPRLGQVNGRAAVLSALLAFKPARRAL